MPEIVEPSIESNTPDLESACRAFRVFIEPVAKTSAVVAVHDSDADGLTAGVIWQRTLERAGFKNLKRVIPDRERNAWTGGNRERIAAQQPNYLFVMDLGSQSTPILDQVPTCFIDHHRPEGDMTKLLAVVYPMSAGRNCCVNLVSTTL